MLAGHVGAEAVLLARRGEEFFAIGPTSSNYGGPLAEGLMVGDTVRCPWHHACFNLRTGQPLRPPALIPVACWLVNRRGNKVFVLNKLAMPQSKKEGGVVPAARSPEKIVIVGGGAAGFAAAKKLRSELYQGSIVGLFDDGRVARRCSITHAASVPANKIGAFAGVYPSRLAIQSRLSHIRSALHGPPPAKTK